MKNTEKVASQLLADTALTKDAFLADWRRWQDYEPVQSAAAAIATLPITRAEWDLISHDTEPYREIYLQPDTTTIKMLDNERYLQGKYNLSVPQMGVVRKLFGAFEQIVTKDGERGGLGKPLMTHSLAQMGLYDPTHDHIGWHADSHTVPAVRYVASYGRRLTTQFMRGEVTRQDIAPSGYLMGDPVKNPAWHITHHSPGTITRFPARFGVHNTPLHKGFRIFMTATIYPEGHDHLTV